MNLQEHIHSFEVADAFRFGFGAKGEISTVCCPWTCPEGVYSKWCSRIWFTRSDHPRRIEDTVVYEGQPFGTALLP